MSDYKQQQLETWSAGDFSIFGAAATLVGENLCEAVRLRAGERVLDVATGAGNTALAAARRATDAVGIDFVPALLERARERAHAERFKRCTFELGDAESLPFPDHSFDVALSTFGCMFAPDPAIAARELVRIVKPGGRIGIAAWTPGGFWGRAFAVHNRFLPAPDGAAQPVAWGEESVVRERFGGVAAGFSFTHRRHIIRARETDQFVPYLCKFFGPTIKVWESLDESRREAFARDMNAVLAGFNESGDQTLFAPGEYLESVITLK